MFHIQLKNVCTNYGQEKILKHINLSINEGELIAIIGKSGSGKTTLLHVIGGFIQPIHGHVYVDEQDIYTLNDHQRKAYMRQRIAFIFQDYHLVDELTVFENIQLPFFIKNEDYDQNYFEQLIDLMDLKHKLDVFPYELSGGQKQKVAALRALLQKPQVLLCDEPTGNLDEKNTEELINILKTCHRKFHQTILLVTHDLDIARNLNRIIRLKDGCIDFDKAGDSYE